MKKQIIKNIEDKGYKVIENNYEFQIIRNNRLKATVSSVRGLRNFAELLTI